MNRELPSQLRGINLNLFVVFDALMRTSSVTHAASDLGVTQSAVSHSLRELRAVLEDPVLVRTGRGMEPTPRARALAPAVRASLEGLGNALQAGPEFEPGTSSRRFSVATADEISMTLLPALAASLQRVAPHVVLEIRSRSEYELEALERGDLDIVLGLLPARAGIDSAPLYQDTFSCLVRADHPSVGSRLTLKRYTALSHVLVGPVNTRGGFVDAALAERGMRRHVAIHTAFFRGAPDIVAHTDYVLTLPTRLARSVAARLPVRILRPPLAIPSFTVHRLWSKKRGADPGLLWLREQLGAAARTLD